MNTITYESYYDKVYGGWYGKCLGGAAGAPVEGYKQFIEVDDFTSIFRPDWPNDDLDLQLLWLETLELKGHTITSRDLADAWVAKCWYPFFEYGYFLKNYKRGIQPPLSGVFNNAFFKESMGCPIRSEIWALTHPGDPVAAARYAKMDGTLDHADNSVWAEQLLAALESMAFFESNIELLLEKGLSYIPSDCRLAQCVRMVMNAHRNDPTDWIGARSRVLKSFGSQDFTSSIQNLGFTVIALLYGEGDMRKTINIALQCGYDADCTCASAAAIVGIVTGFNQLDEELKTLIQDTFVIGIDVQRRSNLIQHLAEDTCRVGVSLQAHSAGPNVITQIPNAYSIMQWPEITKRAWLEVEYVERPAIGFHDRVPFQVIIHNEQPQPYVGKLRIADTPRDWLLQCEEMNVYIEAGGKLVVPNQVWTTEATRQLSNTNILTAYLYDDRGEQVDDYPFGIAGAMSWKLYGPYYEALVKEPDPSIPPEHGEGAVLPTGECMMNNAVYLDKAYRDEQDPHTSSDGFLRIHAYEDMIPIEEHIGLQGQCCVYLEGEIVSPEDQVVWAVIGNNDGFICWVNGEQVIKRDEMRIWTPINNFAAVSLREGSNTIVLKLLRRTEQLRFSFAFREHQGQHHHKQQWVTNLFCR